MQYISLQLILTDISWAAAQEWQIGCHAAYSRCCGRRPRLVQAAFDLSTSLAVSLEIIIAAGASGHLICDGRPLRRIQATPGRCRSRRTRASGGLCVAAPEVSLLGWVCRLLCCPARPLATLGRLLRLGYRRRLGRYWRVAVVGCPLWLLLLHLLVVVVGWLLSLLLWVRRRCTVGHALLLRLQLPVRLLHVRPAPLWRVLGRPKVLPLLRLLLVWPSAMLMILRRWGAVLLHGRPLLMELLLHAGRWPAILLLHAGRWRTVLLLLLLHDGWRCLRMGALRRCSGGASSGRLGGLGSHLIVQLWVAHAGQLRLQH